jgi:hypothetical protein
MNILDRVPSILGDQFTEKLVADIDKLLDYVDTYQASSIEKNYISPPVFASNFTSTRICDIKIEPYNIPNNHLKLQGMFTQCRSA